MALSRGTGLQWHPEGLSAALQRQLAPHWECSPNPTPMATEAYRERMGVS